MRSDIRTREPNLDKLFKQQREVFWRKEREKRSLMLFHNAAEGVPAYKDFLKKHKINPIKIKTWADFQEVPLMNKKDYLREYPLEKICWNGTLKKPLVFTATSGSTGKPFYFARSQELDQQYSVIIESFLRNSSTEENPTLVIVGFGMGIWIGGIITYRAYEIAAQNLNYPISILTPGINKPEIFHALKELAPHFKQTILVGYPPFIKDIIDECEIEGINLKKLNIRLHFAAESFSEKFRDYVAKKAGIKNVYRDILNIYGSADIGAMAHETGVSILIKRLALQDKKLFGDIFSQITKTPTLAQFNPLFINFEAPKGEIALTGNSAIPLIRYTIGDHGGVVEYSDVRNKLKNHGISIEKEKEKNSVGENYEFPFVYVYERVDLSTKLYGAIIYPEHIRNALHDKSLMKDITGKFTILTQHDQKQSQYLEVHIETKREGKISKKLKEKIGAFILRNLLEKNTEYRNNHSSMPSKVTPRIVFWPYEHPLHFKPGIKQKWVKNQ